MTKSAFEHNIRISLAHHMIIPAIFFVILIILLSQIPVFNCLFPAAVSSSEDMSALYHNITADISTVVLIHFITPVTIT